MVSEALPASGGPCPNVAGRYKVNEGRIAHSNRMNGAIRHHDWPGAGT